MLRRTFLATLAAPLLRAEFSVKLPNKSDALRFGLIGDSGTGGDRQYAIAKLLAESRQQFPYNFVLMMGDNIYGSKTPADYRRKFETPYKPLLDAGVKFYAVLGNHDNSDQVNYALFNMSGKRYYTFSPRPDVEFFAVDSNYMDPEQLKWLEGQLEHSKATWKIPFMHHPLYSSGHKHGSDVALRQVIEPMFVKYGVSAVFAGHEHFYERIKPQNGIAYFTSGAAGKLREGNIRTRSELTAEGYDKDCSFMLLEISGDELFFQVIARDGSTVDQGNVSAVHRK
jgi:hypothetical protein